MSFVSLSSCDLKMEVGIKKKMEVGAINDIMDFINYKGWEQRYSLEYLEATSPGDTVTATHLNSCNRKLNILLTWYKQNDCQ